MRLSGFLPVMGRRVVIALGMAGVLLVASGARAQEADPLKFDGTHPAMILLSIKAGTEAGFETSINKMKSMLTANTDPGAQALGNSMQLLKLNVPPSDQGAGPVSVYIVHIDRPVPNVSYNFLRILFYSGYFLPLTEAGEPGGTAEQRKVVDDIYNPLLAAVANITPWPLVKK